MCRNRVWVMFVVFLLMSLFVSNAYATRIGQEKTVYSTSDVYAADDVQSGDDMICGDALSVGGTAEITGAATLSSTLRVDGAIDVNDNVAGDGTGVLSGMLSDIAESTTKTMTVADSGGITLVGGANTFTLPTWTSKWTHTFVSTGLYAFSVDPASTLETMYSKTVVLDGGDKLTATSSTAQTMVVVAGTTSNKWYATCYPDACTDGGA